MREIKFRAWDGKGMITEPRLSYLPDGRIITEHYNDLGAVASSELMQYTGLKDKNGAEIYEGDIVEQEINCMFDKGKHKQQVSFNGRDQFVSGNCSLYQAVNSFCAEVLGNIYENPELLESEL